LEWRDEGDGLGLTALQLAVCCAAPMDRKLAMIEYLLLEGVPLDAVDYTESTALHTAAALGEPLVVTRLLKAGMDPQSYETTIITLLYNPRERQIEPKINRDMRAKI
jgi:ankyrin repeat protein